MEDKTPYTESVGSELIELSNQFSKLIPKLKLAAERLELSMIPPSDLTVMELEKATAKFSELKEVLLNAAASEPGLARSSAEALVSLNDLARLDMEIKEARNRSKEMRRLFALARLIVERVLTIAPVGGGEFPALQGCQDEALLLLDSLTPPEDGVPDTALPNSIIEGQHPLSSLVRMIANADELDEDSLDDLYELVREKYGKQVAVAALRGRLTIAPLPAAGDTPEADGTLQREEAGDGVGKGKIPQAELIETADSWPSLVHKGGAAASQSKSAAALAAKVAISAAPDKAAPNGIEPEGVHTERLSGAAFEAVRAADSFQEKGLTPLEAETTRLLTQNAVESDGTRTAIFQGPLAIGADPSAATAHVHLEAQPYEGETAAKGEHKAKAKGEQKGGHKADSKAEPGTVSDAKGKSGGVAESKQTESAVEPKVDSRGESGTSQVDAEGGSPSATAKQEGYPSCPKCGRLVSPKRGECIFCKTPIAQPENKKGKPHPENRRKVRCARCGRNVFEDLTYYDDDGMVCESCFSG